jgi:hypothetical protein
VRKSFNGYESQLAKTDTELIEPFDNFAFDVNVLQIPHF